MENRLSDQICKNYTRKNFVKKLFLVEENIFEKKKLNHEFGIMNASPYFCLIVTFFVH